jgi:hypothetical protein
MKDSIFFIWCLAIATALLLFGCKDHKEPRQMEMITKGMIFKPAPDTIQIDRPKYCSWSPLLRSNPNQSFHLPHPGCIHSEATFVLH